MARTTKSKTPPRPRLIRWECRRCRVQWVATISPDTPPGRTDEFERTICEACVERIEQRVLQQAGRR